jgi:predicted nucleotidyltransferase
MELHRPLATVTPTLDGDVLAVLAVRGTGFTTGQLHRMLADYSEEGIRKVLTRLTHQGIVRAERVGNAYRYELNQDHLAASAIAELANLPQTLLRRIEERLAIWARPPAYAAVFGSAARGTMIADSDLDLLLVTPDDEATDVWDEQVAALTRDVTAWTGNDTRVLEYTAGELSAHRDEPVLAEILHDGLTVAGAHAWFQCRLRAAS